MSASGVYASGCSRIIAACTAISSARADSIEAPGASRPNSSVIRCVRPISIIAPRWCGLVTTFAMISVSAGYGTEGSSTPTTVAARGPRRMTLPTTAGSLLSETVQNRYVRTAAPAAFGPSSFAFSRRPSTGRRPITSKYDPLTTPALTMRGSLPRPTSVKSTVEKSPKALMVVTRALRSFTSGTENLVFSAPMPGALCRM